MASRLAILVGAEWISMNLTSWLALHWAKSASASRSCFMNASATLRPSSSGLARPKFGVLPHVLHGAGDDGDGVAAPVLGQVAGQPDAVGGVREVAGEGQLGALDPRLLAEQVVVGFLGFAPLGQ